MSIPQYGLDWIRLDAARRKVLRGLEEKGFLGDLWCLYQAAGRLYRYPMSAASHTALREQREKVRALADILDDLKDYFDGSEAWAPAEEPQSEGQPTVGKGYDFAAIAKESLDGLLNAIGPKEIDAVSPKDWYEGSVEWERQCCHKENAAEPKEEAH